MVRSLTKRGMPKPFAILVAALLALYFVPLNALPAGANASDNTTFGGFEMDGNFYEGFANTTTATGPTGDPVDWGSTDIKTQVDVVPDPLAASDPTVYANGSKEDDLSSWADEASAQAPGKGDIGNLYVYDRLYSGDQYLFLAFERESSSGTVTYWLELNQKPNTTNVNNAVVPNRTLGDIRIAITQDGNGSFKISSVKKWNGSSFQDVTLPAGSFELRVNDSTVSIGDLPKWTNVSRPAKYFVEASFNLSKLGVDLECPSTGFASAFLRSQSSKENANPELKDYATGPINVPSNCSQFKIEKRKGQTDGALLPGATFSISPNPFPGKSTPDPVNVEDGGPGDADGEANGTVLINPAKPDTYTVTEVTPPPGYIKGSGSQEVVAAPYAQDPAVLVFTNDLGKAQWSKVDASNLQPVSGAVFKVTRTGPDDGVSFPAAYVKDDAGAGATITVPGAPSVTATNAADANDAPGVVKLKDLPTGDYQVKEVVPPQGYALPSVVTRTFSISTTELVRVEDAFADPRLLSKVRVNKVDADNGDAPLNGALFTLFKDSNGDGVLQPVTDTTVGTCATGDASGDTGYCTIKDLDFGSYWWVETTPPAGYQLPSNPVSDTDPNAGGNQPFVIDATNAGGQAQQDNARVWDYTFGDPQKRVRLVVLKYDEQLYNQNSPDNTAALVSGATFRLWQDKNGDGQLQDTDKVVGTCTTGDSSFPTGQCSIENLGFGTYWWEETVAPAGFKLPTVTVSAPIVVDATTADDLAETPSTTIFTDPRKKASLTVRKVDQATGGTLDGAVFQLWRDDAGDGLTRDDKDTLIGSCTTGDGAKAGECSLGGLLWEYDYYWYEVTAPAGYNLPAQRTSAAVRVDSGNVDKPFDVTVFADPKTTISTLATPTGALPNAQISDTATVRGLPSADTGGSVTFRLYATKTGTYPDAVCSGQVGAAISGSPLNLVADPSNPGTFMATSDTGSVTVADAGTYYWIASYSGDADKGVLGATGACGEPGESTVVGKAPTSISTNADTEATLLGKTDGTIHDQATVSGLSPNATGTVSFELYGPVDRDKQPGARCTDGAKVTLPASFRDIPIGTVTEGQAVVESPEFAATLAGTYQWVAHYSGDVNNDPADGQCGDPGETSEVGKAATTIQTFATGSSLITPSGTDPLTDRVRLYGFTAGDVKPTGTISVDVYGPLESDTSCAEQPSAAGPYEVDLGAATSGSDTQGYYLEVSTPQFVPTAAGIYRWAARYSGDRNYASSAGKCPDAAEVSRVSKPTLDKAADPATVASPEDGPPTVVPRGSTITYTLTVTNTGAAAIDNEPLVDTLPANVTFTRVTGSTPQPVQNLDTSGRATLTWSVSLAAGQSAAFTYTVSVEQTASSADLLVNVARFLGLEDQTTHQVGVPVPTLDKSSPNEGATVPLGSTIHYKVVVGNTGNYPITGRPLVDTLPDGVTYVSGSATSSVTGGASVSTAPTAGTSGGNSTLTWIATLPPGATATVEFDVTVDADNLRGAQLRNTAAFESLTDVTVHYVGIPGPTLDKFSNPVTTDAAPALVQPGTRIDYSVTVGNNGNLPITDAAVVDTLPGSVTVVPGTISDGGTLSADGKTITWTVTLTPGATKTLTYAVTVDKAAPQGAVLVNTARFQDLTDTTTHVVPTGALSLVKGVSPVAGNGVVVKFGDTLTYTLTASATGELNQTNVVVTDYLPGKDPARTESGATTYVAGSATCIGAGTCTVTGPDANGLITWSLGDLAAGSSRQVTFQVTIDDVTGAAGETVAVDILNAGAVQSNETGRTPSNEVVTPVTKTLPVKVGRTPPGTLPKTGPSLPIGPTVGAAILLLGLGMLLLAASRRRSLTA